MHSELKPRIPDIDADHFRKVLNSCIDYIPKLRQMLADEPGKLEQTRYSSLHAQYLMTTEHQFALGYPLCEVRTSARNTLEIWREVLKRRGTEESFFVLKVRLDARYPSDDPRHVIEQGPLHPPGTNDYSIGNSVDNYTMICLALSIGDHQTAAQLAPQTWDPPDASYIAPRAEYTSTAHQRIAYALRDLYENQLERAIERLLGLSVSPRWDQKDLLAQAEMLRAVARQDASLFLHSLEAQLDWQRQFAAQVKKHFKSWAFLAVHSLGLSSLAVSRNLVSWEALPQDNPFLPVELARQRP